MKFKVTLARGSFLFGDEVSLYRGNQVTLESKDLGYADLSILANRVKSGDIECSVQYEVLRDAAEQLAPVVEVSKVVFESAEKASQEIIEIEQEEEKANEVTPEVLAMQELIQKEVIDAPTSVAVKAIKAFKEEKDEQFFEVALAMEETTRNRVQVVRAIKA
mgnify:FL=1